MYLLCNLCSRPTYRYSQLSQEDEDDMEGSETFKYNPRPKGLRAYRDYDTSDDVSEVNCEDDSVRFTFYVVIFQGTICVRAKKNWLVALKPSSVFLIPDTARAFFGLVVLSISPMVEFQSLPANFIRHLAKISPEQICEL